MPGSSGWPGTKVPGLALKGPGRTSPAVAHIRSGRISMAPHGHSLAQMPQPLQ
jgi:hypothetical protein